MNEIPVQRDHGHIDPGIYSDPNRILAALGDMIRSYGVNIISIRNDHPSQFQFRPTATKRLAVVKEAYRRCWTS